MGSLCKDSGRRLDGGQSLERKLPIRPSGYAITPTQNIDRRPPTMLKLFTILHTPPKSLAIHVPTSSTHLSLHVTSVPGAVTLCTSPPFRTYELSILNFFAGQLESFRQVARSWDPPVDCISHMPKLRSGLTSRIQSFKRTAEGDAIAVTREDGSRDIWTRGKAGRLKLLAAVPAEEAKKAPAILCVFNEGAPVGRVSVTKDSRPLRPDDGCLQQRATTACCHAF